MLQNNDLKLYKYGLYGHTATDGGLLRRACNMGKKWVSEE